MFRPARTRQVTERISVLRTLFSNFYLYKTEDGYLAFDCGINPFLCRLALGRLGIAPASVKAVFLTHSDADHRGGLRLFPDAAVYLPEAEVPMVTRQKARRAFLYNAGIKRYTPLGDGESVTVGGTAVTLAAAPGHTVGSACYRIGDDAVATGDLLLIQGGGRVTQFSIVQNMEHAHNLATLKRLVAEGLFAGNRYVLTGHSGCEKTGALSFDGLASP